MSYESIDKLQAALSENVFHYTKDPKKAAGRALGTMIEIITYYLLKSWGLNDSISIEKGLAEFGNPDITHNVEYSLHPILNSYNQTFPKKERAISGKLLLTYLDRNGINVSGFASNNVQLLTKNLILRNACTIGKGENSNILSSIETHDDTSFNLRIYEQHHKPYAIFECKRVGVENGMKKGPQTIEKAKQGAYVAKSVSSLFKFRNKDGEMMGIIENDDGSFLIKSSTQLMEEIIYSENSSMLSDFILTVGVVSNHGNWFTSENQNKEMKVLAQSYDWLLFLTDKGLSEFIGKLILNPNPDCEPVRDAFSKSYTADKKKNLFTKVQMGLEADAVLLYFFKRNLEEIESWFNVISPDNKNIHYLKDELIELKNKNWKTILL
jgi:hypothetical protein